MEERLRADVKAGYACNNNCLFCVVADKRRHGDLTTGKVKKQLDASWENGARSVVLTGGEVTIRKDVFDLVSHAKKCGFENIQIQTNARMLSNLDFAKKLVGAGANVFAPALHGCNAKMHDYLVQCKGAFNQTLEGIKNAKLLGVPVLSNTVVTKPNFEHVEEIARILIDLEAESCQLAFVHANGNAWDNFDLIVPPISRASVFIKKALREGKNTRTKMMVEAVPPCLMTGFEQYCSEKFIPKTEVRAPDYFTKDFEKERKEEGKCKGENCKKCALFKSCEGPWKEYPQKRGWKEFKPVH
ncbi:MAG: radical SAM protein [Candidatus Micrarchaeia archaeon]